MASGNQTLSIYFWLVNPPEDTGGVPRPTSTDTLHRCPLEVALSSLCHPMIC